MTASTSRASMAALALLAWPVVAAAHPGSAAARAPGFADGFLHPFTGLDHLGAMLAVGLWSARSARRAWLAPLAFPACLLAGALAAAQGLAVPGIEPMIAFSLLAFGLLMAQGMTLPPVLTAGLVGFFAWFHGAAHGLALGTGPGLAGMLLATAALHAAGIGVGRVLQRRSAWWARGAGLAVAAFGLSLLAAR
jgi:urease accessory protein